MIGYRTRVVLRQFDKNGDNRITRNEMQAQPFLFDRMDANKDGVVTAEELSAYFQREQRVKKAAPSPKAKPPAPSADSWTPVDENTGSASVAYLDPEFLQRDGLVTLADQNGDVWVGAMDLQTGGFAKPNGGRDRPPDRGGSAGWLAGRQKRYRCLNVFTP